MIITRKNPVFIAVGIGGKPYRPNSISLIPLNEIYYSELYKSVLRKYEIPASKSIDLNTLIQLINKTFFNISGSEVPIKHNSNSNNLFKTKSFQLSILILAIIVLVYVIVSFFNKPSNQFALSKIDEQNLRTRVKDYYQSLDYNDVEVLNNFINEQVDKWYDTTNVDLAYVKKRASIYYSKYPYHKSQIDWNSFSASILANGDYAVNYNLKYQIKKPNQSNFSNYLLHISSIWNRRLMIKSMYEEKLKN